MVKASNESMTNFAEIGENYFSRNSFITSLLYFEKALVLDPSIADHVYKIGFCNLQNLNHERARQYFESVLLIEKYHEKTIQNLGIAWNLAGETQCAIHCFQISCCITPSNFASNYNLGIAYFSLKQHEQSKNYLKHAALINPSSHEVSYNLGVIANQSGNHALAVQRYLDSISLDPSQSSAYFNLGVSYFELSIAQKAIDSYQLALSIDPQHIQSHWNLSHCLLLIDDYKNGFIEYEWRWKQNEVYYQQKQRSFSSHLWLGQEPLDHKTILIFAEQGFGDTLQFIRFCNHHFFKNSTVVLEVQTDLVNLVRSSFPNVNVIALGQGLVESDFHIPLMSLPLALGIESPQALYSEPYVFPSTQSVDEWKIKTINISNPRIGLVWSSGYRIDQEETWEANKKRNLQLLNFHFLREFDASFFTLQKGFIPQSEFEALKNEKWGGPFLIDFTHELVDFEQTAALISQLDLIITVDTSVAHLAGAMGKPTLLLLKFNADWRWHHLSEKSKWYPNSRIFRQPTPGDWKSPLEQLNQHLRSILVTADYSQLL